jgi:hypothetical protein
LTSSEDESPPLLARPPLLLDEDAPLSSLSEDELWWSVSRMVSLRDDKLSLSVTSLDMLEESEPELMDEGVAILDGMIRSLGFIRIASTMEATGRLAAAADGVLIAMGFGSTL